MIRAVAAASVALIAAVAVAQTVSAPERPEGSRAASTLIPEIPAGADPMKRRPDPAAGSPAATPPRQQPESTGEAGTECHVRRADTDTGFVVVCEEG